MHIAEIVYILGWLFVCFAAAMLPAVGMGLWFGTGGVWALLGSMAVILAAGGACVFSRRSGEEIDLLPREGFLIVTLAWFGCGLFGGLPFFLSGMFLPEGVWTGGNMRAAFTDSVFESVSGLTTTGASVLTDFDQPHALMFWRATLHWLGGMGIIVLSLAILPLIGAAGMQLFRAEVPGPVADRLKPRVRDTAMTLSGVYVLVTGLQTGALMGCGMNLYEALCHAFATVATGGFSTHPQSVGGYESAAVNYVIVFFMAVAGCNFALHYRFMRGEWNAHWRNGEFKAYLGILAGAVLILTLFVKMEGDEATWAESIEHSAFQAVSIMTTTGFATADYEAWHPMGQVLLFYLMFVGGCAGSTGGGIKVIRAVLLAKFAYREMYRLIYPTSVSLIKQDGETVAPRVADGVLGFLVLVAATFMISTLFLSLYGLDFVTSLSATAACLFNIGPGLGEVGPYDNYAALPGAVKWWLSACMVIGRLEVYSVLILTAPEFWRK